MKKCTTPGEAVLHGAAAGLVGTVMLTILVRIAPAMRDKPTRNKPQKAGLPADPFNEREVQEWQDRQRSPAAYAGARRVVAQERQVHAPSVTPAGALAQAQGPGPEGAAEHFALKVASGLFGRDLSQRSKVAGEIVHYSYGTFWGIVYGLVHRSFQRPPPTLGPAFGFALWGFGPGYLVPRMKLMPRPSQERPVRNALMIVGHVLFGIALSGLMGKQEAS